MEVRGNKCGNIRMDGVDFFGLCFGFTILGIVIGLFIGSFL